MLMMTNSFQDDDDENVRRCITTYMCFLHFDVLFNLNKRRWLLTIESYTHIWLDSTIFNTLHRCWSLPWSWCANATASAEVAASRFVGEWWRLLERLAKSSKTDTTERPESSSGRLDHQGYQRQMDGCGVLYVVHEDLPEDCVKWKNTSFFQIGVDSIVSAKTMTWENDVSTKQVLLFLETGLNCLSLRDRRAGHSF